MTRYITNAICAAGLAFTGFTGTAYAEHHTTHQDYEALKARVEALEKKAVVPSKSGVGFSFPHSGITFDLKGAVGVDVSTISLEDQSGDKFGNTGTELRRVNLVLKTTLAEDYLLDVKLAFEGNSANLAHAYFAYKGWNFGTLQVGQFKVPFSLEKMTGSTHAWLMEGSSVSSLSPSERVGIGLLGGGTNHHWHTALYTATSGSNDEDNVDEGFGWAGRFSWAPVNEKTKAIHLGVSGQHNRYTSDAMFRLRTDPRMHNAPQIIDTGSLANVDSDTRVAAEVAAFHGPFAFQSEYAHVWTSAETGSEPNFSAWYAQGSWFVTGQTKRYSAKSGKFANGKWKNAVELLLRYDVMDLTDGTVFGGEQRVLTGAVNYYVLKNLRLKAQVNHIRADEFSTPGDIEGWGAGFRVQGFF